MADHPLDHLLRILTPVAEAFEKLVPGQAIRAAYDRDYDKAVCRAADALADDEAEYEVLEPDSEMDWLGWAVPAILTELALHRHRRDRYCRCRLYCETHHEWADHVAPLIAKRIGCDPARAAKVLLRYKPAKVDL